MGDVATPLTTETVFRQLRAMARRYMASERSGHTLQPTALISEAYLRLAKDNPEVWNGHRPFFFREAARAMRQILVDHARRKNAEKRGGGRTRVTLHPEMALQADDDSVDLLTLHSAMNELAALSPRQVEVIDLRYWAGLSVAEVAEHLQVSETTVKTDTRIGLAWLRRRLEEP